MPGLTTLAKEAGVICGVSDSLDVASVEGWRVGDIALVYNDTRASFVFITGVQDSSSRLTHDSGSSSAGIFDDYNNNKLGPVGTTYGGEPTSRGSGIPGTPSTARPRNTPASSGCTSTTARTSRLTSWRTTCENMQIRLGVYDNVTGIITWRDGDHFTTTPSDLARVRSSEDSLVGRTSIADPSWDEGPYYDRDDEGPNSTGFNRSTGITGYDHHRRRPIEQVIFLRNTGAIQ